MRLSKEVYDWRMRQIIAGFLRLIRLGVKPENIPVKTLVYQYGFVRFTKTEELRSALIEMHKWIVQYRFRHPKGYSPETASMLSFVKDRL